MPKLRESGINTFSVTSHDSDRSLSEEATIDRHRLVRATHNMVWRRPDSHLSALRPSARSNGPGTGTKDRADGDDFMLRGGIVPQAH